MNILPDFICTQCDKRVPRNAAFQEKFSEEEHNHHHLFHEELNQQLAKMGRETQEYVELKEDSRFWHTAYLTIRAGGGRIGCHIQEFTCGPLRELNETDEELARLENLFDTCLR